MEYENLNLNNTNLYGFVVDGEDSYFTFMLDNDYLEQYCKENTQEAQIYTALINGNVDVFVGEDDESDEEYSDPSMFDMYVTDSPAVLPTTTVTASLATLFEEGKKYYLCFKGAKLGSVSGPMPTYKSGHYYIGEYYINEDGELGYYEDYGNGAGSFSSLTSLDISSGTDYGIIREQHWATYKYLSLDTDTQTVELDGDYPRFTYDVPGNNYSIDIFPSDVYECVRVEDFDHFPKEQSHEYYIYLDPTYEDAYCTVSIDGTPYNIENNQVIKAEFDWICANFRFTGGLEKTVNLSDYHEITVTGEHCYIITEPYADAKLIFPVTSIDTDTDTKEKVYVTDLAFSSDGKLLEVSYSNDTQNDRTMPVHTAATVPLVKKQITVPISPKKFIDLINAIVRAKPLRKRNT